MYQLGLLGTSPSADYGKLLCYSLVAGFFGLSYAVGLRKMFLIRIARPLSLVYPTGSAAAVTIRTLHSETDGKSSKTLAVPSITFCASLVWPIASSYAPGVLYELNFFWYIFKWGGHGAIYAVNWGWATVMTSPAVRYFQCCSTLFYLDWGICNISLFLRHDEERSMLPPRQLLTPRVHSTLALECLWAPE